jgi:tetratricopeptide (TPR) repeat protein
MAKDFDGILRLLPLGEGELGEQFPDEMFELINSIPIESWPSSEKAQILSIRGHLSEQLQKFDDAIFDYQESIALLQRPEDQQMRMQVLESVARVQARTKRFDEAVGSHKKALEFYQATGDKDGVMRELFGLGSAWRRSGDLSKAREILDKALEIAKDADDRAAQAVCLNNLALTDWDDGDFEKAESGLKESIQLAHIAQDHHGEANGLENLAELYRLQLRVDEMTNLLLESSEEFKRAGEQREFKRLQAACAQAMCDKGGYDEGIALCEMSLDEAEIERRVSSLAFSGRYDEGDMALLSVLMTILRKKGEHMRAHLEASKLLTVAKSMRNPKLVARAEIEMSLIDKDSGNFAAALGHLDYAENILRREQDSDGLVAVYTQKGLLYDLNGNSDKAKTNYREALRHAEKSGNKLGIAVSMSNLGKSLGFDNKEGREYVENSNAILRELRKPIYTESLRSRGVY